MSNERIAFTAILTANTELQITTIGKCSKKVKGHFPNRHHASKFLFTHISTKQVP